MLHTWYRISGNIQVPFTFQFPISQVFVIFALPFILPGHILNCLLTEAMDKVNLKNPAYMTIVLYIHISPTFWYCVEF